MSVIKNDYKLLNSTDIENNTVSNLESNQIEMVEITQTIEPNDSNKTNKNKSNKNNLVKNIQNYEVDSLKSLILAIFATLAILFTFGTFVSVVALSNFILRPSYLKYCDNYYKKCEYYQTTGTLVNNTLTEKYNNFNIEYVLSSSYEYIPYSNKYNNSNNYSHEYVCDNVQIHKFDSIDEASKVSIKSIGTVSKIFVSYDNNNKCLMNFNYYNPEHFMLNVSVVIHLFSLTIVGILLGVYNFYEIQSIENQFGKRICMKFISFISGMIFIIMMGISIISSFAVIYYIFLIGHI